MQWRDPARPAADRAGSLAVARALRLPRSCTLL